MKSPLLLMALAALIPTLSSADAQKDREAALVSPFPSTIEGLDIPNAHLVGQGPGQVLRGMGPVNAGEASFGALKSYGVNHVLIFKDEVKGDIRKERESLAKVGYTEEQITEIPFLWRNVESFESACRQLVQGLDLLEQAYSTPGAKIYFHCTVGEDRTGMLAGLFRMLETPPRGGTDFCNPYLPSYTECLADAREWDMERSFKEEMCLNGYEAGNPQKPDGTDPRLLNVVSIIRQELTPTYLKMATLIQSGRLRPGNLDASVCTLDVDVSHIDASKYRCEASPRYRPTKK